MAAYQRSLVASWQSFASAVKLQEGACTLYLWRCNSNHIERSAYPLAFCPCSLHSEIQAAHSRGDWRCTATFTDLERIKSVKAAGLKSTDLSRASFRAAPAPSALQAPAAAPAAGQHVPSASAHVPGGGLRPAEPSVARASSGVADSFQQQQPNSERAPLPRTETTLTVAALPKGTQPPPMGATSDTGRSVQNGAALPVGTPAAQPAGQGLRASAAVDHSWPCQQDGDRAAAAAAAATQRTPHRVLPSQASTVCYEGADTLPCTNDSAAGPSTLQVCLLFNDVKLRLAANMNHIYSHVHETRIMLTMATSSAGGTCGIFATGS